MDVRIKQFLTANRNDDDTRGGRYARRRRRPRLKDEQQENKASYNSATRTYVVALVRGDVLLLSRQMFERNTFTGQ